MIQTCVIFFRPKSKGLPLDTKSCAVVSVSNILKAYIHQYYHGVSVFFKLKYQSYNAQNIISDEMANSLF